MQRARNELLARAGLAQNENGGVPVGGKADGLLHAPDRLARTDEAAAGLDSAWRRCRISSRQHAEQDGFQVIAAARLWEMIQTSQSPGLHAFVRPSQSR